jgi:hypothetical protein
MQPEEAVRRTETEVIAQSVARRKEEKPLKPYRSQAEKIALHQRNIQIALTATNVIVACLTCLKVFGIV